MHRLPILLATLALSGCDLLGIESAQSVAARKEAEGRAIGSACRHAARALEDCFALNRKADKASILAGWREMSDYMRENKIEAVAPRLSPTTASADAKPAAAEPAVPGTQRAEPPAKGSPKAAAHES